VSAYKHLPNNIYIDITEIVYRESEDHSTQKLSSSGSTLFHYLITYTLRFFNGYLLITLKAQS